MRTVRPGLAAARRLASPRAIRSASAMAPAAAAPLAGPADVTATIDALNEEYAAVHRAFEENFWAVKMGLKARYVVTFGSGRGGGFVPSRRGAAMLLRAPQPNPRPPPMTPSGQLARVSGVHQVRLGGVAGGRGQFGACAGGRTVAGRVGGPGPDAGRRGKGEGRA